MRKNTKKLLILLYVAGLLVSYSRKELKLQLQIQKEMQISLSQRVQIKNLKKILDKKLYKKI